MQPWLWMSIARHHIGAAQVQALALKFARPVYRFAEAELAVVEFPSPRNTLQFFNIILSLPDTLF